MLKIRQITISNITLMYTIQTAEIRFTIKKLRKIFLLILPSLGFSVFTQQQQQQKFY